MWYDLYYLLLLSRLHNFFFLSCKLRKFLMFIYAKSNRNSRLCYPVYIYTHRNLVLRKTEKCYTYFIYLMVNLIVLFPSWITPKFLSCLALMSFWGAGLRLLVIVWSCLKLCLRIYAWSKFIFLFVFSFPYLSIDFTSVYGIWVWVIGFE